MRNGASTIGLTTLAHRASLIRLRCNQGAQKGSPALIALIAVEIDSNRGRTIREWRNRDRMLKPADDGGADHRS